MFILVRSHPDLEESIPQVTAYWFNAVKLLSRNIYNSQLRSLKCRHRINSSRFSSVPPHECQNSTLAQPFPLHYRFSFDTESLYYLPDLVCVLKKLNKVSFLSAVVTPVHRTATAEDTSCRAAMRQSHYSKCLV